MRTIAVAVAAAVCAMACSAHSEPQGRIMRHDNGLAVTAVAAWEAEVTPQGFRFRPVGWQDMRSPGEILLETHAAAPAGEFPQSRRVDGTDARYRVDTHPGGSGGDERSLTAWTTIGGRIVVLQQTSQSEDPGEGDFEEGWALLGSARIEP